MQMVDSQQGKGVFVDAAFHTTRWSVVLAARTTSTPHSNKALSSLCEDYWYPLYVFVRRQGYTADEARDLTQGYFLQLLQKKFLRDVDPDAGRFRSFLLVSLKHYLLNERDRARALKRGGGKAAIPLDADDAESRYSVEPVDDLTAEMLYERRWALTVLDRVQQRLCRESSAAGKRDHYDKLHGFITSGEQRRPYDEIASELGLSRSAVKMAVHRMRRRFGELLREEISQTVASPDQVEVEIRYLLTKISE